MDLSNIDWSYVLWGSLLFVVSFTTSLLLVGWLLVRLPEDYFLDSYERAWWVDRHPLIRWCGLLLKNLGGLLLILFGIVLSLPGVPGQGLLTVLIGLTLVDFPGKRRVELFLIRRGPVQRTVNALRRRYGKPPLQLP